MLKRPSKSDTDEDLLKFQEEFLASKSAPAVTLVKKHDKKTVETEESKGVETSKDFVKLKDLPHSSNLSAPPEKKLRFQQQLSKGDTDEDDPEERLDKHDRHITKVLSEIVEHDFKSPTVYFPIAPMQGGFPKVLHRGDDHKDANQKASKKKSLFAQQFLKSKPETFGIRPQEEKLRKQPFLAGDVIERTVNVESMDTGLASPGLITHEGLARANVADESHKIHEENMATISGMSEQEILIEQANLLTTLDPSLVDYLRKKKQRSNVSESESSGSQNNNKPPSLYTSEQNAIKNRQSNAQTSKQIDSSDLPVKPEKDWVNMTNMEYDKLEWMTKLPKPKPNDSGTGQTARFDFQGSLVSADSDIPVHLGLHHHGQEPDKAGYTLEEIFHLSRSSNMQQRVMALHILKNIITNARHGKFYECTSTYIIPALVEGGLVFILRWALDDSTDNTMSASVSLLHALLVCKEDEVFLDKTFHWHLGHIVPSLCSQEKHTNSTPDDNDGENAEETDADILKKDIIQGLLRMSLLPRLRFILTKWHPPAIAVIQILEVLVRIARHSQEAAYQITECSGLLETISKEFLPLDWNPISENVSSLADVYGYPVPQALKLFRVLCSAGRNMAASIVSTYNILPCVTRYLCDTVTNLQLQPNEAEILYLEAYRTWQVCTSYGLSVVYYENMYSVLLQRLQSLHNSITERELQYFGTALISWFESIVQVAASVTIARVKQKSVKTGDLSNGECNVSTALPPVDWSQVHGLFLPISNYMENCLKHFTNNYFDKPYDLSYLSAVVNFVATYLSQVESQPGYDAVDTLSLLENLCDNILVPCIGSQAFTLTLSNLRQFSVLLIKTKSKRGEVTKNLPELGALYGDHMENCPVLETGTTVHFLIAFTRLLLTTARIHKGVIPKLIPLVLSHDEILQYIRRLCLWEKAAPLATNYFAKFENQLQYNLIKMCRLNIGQNREDTKLYHLMSLHLLIHLHHGNEYLAHNLLSAVAFNAEFLTDVTGEDESASRNLESLKLEEEKYLISATAEIIKKGHKDLVNDITDNLVAVRNSYLLAVAGLIGSLQSSRNRALPNPLEVDSLQSGEVGQLLVPVDWPFLPLVELYNNSLNRAASGKDAKLDIQVENMATNTLRWVYLLECWRPGVLDSISVTLKISRLLCVFLAGNDLFLSSNVHGYLLSLLKIYCKPGKIERINFEEKIPGLPSFYDIYMLLLTHYEAVSFGDPLFACYVLLPQQQRHNYKYRQAIWGEYIGVLQALTIPLDQVVIPIESFLEPEETRLELLRLLFQALFSETILPYRNPLPYLIAVHHLNRFFYTQDGKHKKLKAAFIRQSGSCKNKSLCTHLFKYKMFNPEEKFGIEIYNEMPANRRSLLEDHEIKQETYL